MKSLNPFDYLGLDSSTITEMLNEWGCQVDEPTVKHYMYIGIPVFLLCFCVVRILAHFIGKRRKINRWRREKIEEKLGREFGMFIDNHSNFWYRLWYYFVGKKARNIFIETKFQVNPPHDKEDPKENSFTEPPHNLIDFYIKKVLVKDNKPGFLYCVLGGSGMGKTTFSVNLIKRYYYAHTEKDLPYDIFLLSLSNETVMQDIQRIAEPQKSILILDALDENTDAVRDYAAFISQLEDAVSHFRIVIVTCRTQFFANEESEPNRSKLTYYSKGLSFQEYTRHYITIFDDDDIENYIRQRFGLNKKKRRSARHIVDKCSSVLVRPLLLSYIDDLVGSPSLETFFTCDIYSALIDKWIVREVNFWETKKQRIMPELKSQLYEFSEKLALEIFTNRESTGGLFTTANDFDVFLKQNNYTGPYSYSGRSLVNRDSAGNCKFAHKSFLEYFLALQMFKNNVMIPFEGMDMVKAFYHELCMKEFSSLVHQNKVGSAYYGKTSVLIINDVDGYKLEHLNVVDIWRVIMISWGAATDRFIDWLMTNHQMERLVVFNYNGAGTLKKILKLHHLKSLFILGDDVPSNNFVRKIENKVDIFDWKHDSKRVSLTSKDIETIMQKIEISHLLSNKKSVIRVINQHLN